MNLAPLLTQPPAPDPQLVGSSFRLLLVVALLGVILVTGLTLMLVLRRNRLARARRQRAGSIQTPDPWSEAGKRTPVPDDETDEPNAPPSDPPLG